mmetsp:Transcript_10732/g.25467  ORF Transcript_10732/g.25467 Transcript_10732/m.25467 type:complete len:254 (-) Transcript_10732:326-1087(-)
MARVVIAVYAEPLGVQAGRELSRPPPHDNALSGHRLQNHGPCHGPRSGAPPGHRDGCRVKHRLRRSPHPVPKLGLPRLQGTAAGCRQSRRRRHHAAGYISEPFRWAAEPLLRCEPRGQRPGVQSSNDASGRFAVTPEERVEGPQRPHHSSPPLELQHRDVLWCSRRNRSHVGLEDEAPQSNSELELAPPRCGALRHLGSSACDHECRWCPPDLGPEAQLSPICRRESGRDSAAGHGSQSCGIVLCSGHGERPV